MYGTRRDGIITYDGGRFYPADNRNYTMDPVRLFVEETRREEKEAATRDNGNFIQCDGDPCIAPERHLRASKRTGGGSSSSSSSSSTITGTWDRDESEVVSICSDPAIRREFNRGLYNDALRGNRSLSFIYNGGTQPGVRRIVKPASGSESNTEKFRAYDSNGVLKTYYYSKVDQMKMVAQ